MATVTTEVATVRIAEPKAATGKTGTVPRRRRGARAAEPSTARFFLIKTSGNGTVELGQEVTVCVDGGLARAGERGCPVGNGAAGPIRRFYPLGRIAAVAPDTFTIVAGSTDRTAR